MGDVSDSPLPSELKRIMVMAHTTDNLTEFNSDGKVSVVHDTHGDAETTYMYPFDDVTVTMGNVRAVWRRTGDTVSTTVVTSLDNMVDFDGDRDSDDLPVTTADVHDAIRTYLSPETDELTHRELVTIMQRDTENEYAVVLEHELSGFTYYDWFNVNIGEKVRTTTRTIIAVDGYTHYLDPYGLNSRSEAVVGLDEEIMTNASWLDGYSISTADTKILSGNWDRGTMTLTKPSGVYRYRTDSGPNNAYTAHIRTKDGWRIRSSRTKHSGGCKVSLYDSNGDVSHEKNYDTAGLLTSMSNSNGVTGYGYERTDDGTVITVDDKEVFTIKHVNQVPPKYITL